MVFPAFPPPTIYDFFLLQYRLREDMDVNVGDRLQYSRR